MTEPQAKVIFFSLFFLPYEFLYGIFTCFASMLSQGRRHSLHLANIAHSQRGILAGPSNSLSTFSISISITTNASEVELRYASLLRGVH